MKSCMINQPKWSYGYVFSIGNSYSINFFEALVNITKIDD